MPCPEIVYHGEGIISTSSHPSAGNRYMTDSTDWHLSSGPNYNSCTQLWGASVQTPQNREGRNCVINGTFFHWMNLGLQWRHAENEGDQQGSIVQKHSVIP